MKRRLLREKLATRELRIWWEVPYHPLRFREIAATLSTGEMTLNLSYSSLARKIHGNLAPTTTYHGQLGENTSPEAVSVYSLDRIPGISYIEYLLADTHGRDSEENVALRVGLMTDLAR